MLKSIRILLSIAAYYDYVIWQMNVKTAFLNGNLEEKIYMMQPESFMLKNQKHMVCKLKRSIYGLKYLDHGTSYLIKQSSHLVLNKNLMNHVCIRDIKIK